MNFKAVYDLAVVLTKSQLRGSQRSKWMTRLFGNPRIILVVDVAILLGLGLFGYILLSYGPASLGVTIRSIEAQGLAGIPTAVAFAVIVFGVLYEVSQPVQSMSTDLVNWLPISPAEYVAGSTISEAYMYSFMVCFLLGSLLGPAFFFGMGHVWAGAAAMALVALFIGACVVELIDAITNRISSSFYKRSARSGIIFRLAITIAVLVFIQLIFSGQIVVYVLQSLIQTVTVAWFVPVVWPSVSVLSISQGNPIGAGIFGLLSLGFTFLLYAIAVDFRARFWVPVPVSIRISSGKYRPQKAFRLPGISAAESAILRKDFRSLVRRREMARFLAIPFVLAVSMGISMYPLRGQALPEQMGMVTLIPLYIIPLAIFCDILGMTSIGQEGNAVWNLYAAPVRPSQILRAKMLYVLILGALFGLAMIAVVSLLTASSLTGTWLYMILGAGIVLEQSSLGLYFGAKFPDFRETIRSRYVSLWGSLFGMFAGLVAAMATVAPVLVSAMMNAIDLMQLAAVSFAVALAAFAIAWKLATRQLNRLLRNIWA
jgi:hypothetical protein